MRAADKVGTALVVAACACAWMLGNALPSAPSIGTVALYAAMALLALRVVREAVLSFDQRGVQAFRLRMRRRARRRYCVGVLTLLALVLATVGCLLGEMPVEMSPLRWAIAALVVLGVGFVAQDFVLSLRPFVIRYDPTHRRLTARIAPRRSARRQRVNVDRRGSARPGAMMMASVSR